MQLWFYEDFAEIYHFNCANPGILFLGLPEPRVVAPAQTKALIFLRDVGSHLHAEFEPKWPRAIQTLGPPGPWSKHSAREKSFASGLLCLASQISPLGVEQCGYLFYALSHACTLAYMQSRMHTHMYA